MIDSPFPQSIQAPEVVWLDSVPETLTEPEWLWRGYLACGALTLFTSPWKMGKTTLLAILLSKMRAGGELAGLPVAAGKALVVSEESMTLWKARAVRLGLGGHVCVLARPFVTRPSMEQWQELIGRIEAIHAGHRLDLAVIDPLTSFLPGHSESTAAAMMDALLPLRRLTERGLAVLLQHHPRKGAEADGQSARGSGALASHADVLLEMTWYTQAADDDRRRVLQGWSRYDETPRQVVLELNAEGTDYVSHGDFAQDTYVQGWGVLRRVLEDAPHKLTRQEVLEWWPLEAGRPSVASVYRWLEQAVEAGLVRQEGSGRRGDPYLCWLPEMEERWQSDPVAQLENDMRAAQRMLPEDMRRALDTPPRRRGR
jgi:hypothetical protein